MLHKVRLNSFAFADAAKVLVNDTKYKELLQEAARTGGRPAIEIGFDSQHHLCLEVIKTEEKLPVVTEFLKFEIPYPGRSYVWGYAIRLREGIAFPKYTDIIFGVVVDHLGRHPYTAGIIERSKNPQEDGSIGYPGRTLEESVRIVIASL